jgi:hypothetical protein
MAFQYERPSFYGVAPPNKAQMLNSTLTFSKPFIRKCP